MPIIQILELTHWEGINWCKAQLLFYIKFYKMIQLFAGNPTGLQNPSSQLVSPPLTPSPPSNPTKGPSFLMKYSPNDLPGPCCSNHSQEKHWSDECASALHVGGLRGTKTVSAPPRHHTDVSVVPLLLPNSKWLLAPGFSLSKRYRVMFLTLS